jgi:hypothetical protein
MMIRKYLLLIAIVLPVLPSALLAEQVRFAAKDGMSLELGNYTQQVKVRAKALGSKTCNVEFTVKGKVFTVTAPANEYSEWVGIGPTFYGPSNEKLGVSVKCDDGAIAQVTYHQ